MARRETAPAAGRPVRGSIPPPEPFRSPGEQDCPGPECWPEPSSYLKRFLFRHWRPCSRFPVTSAARGHQLNLSPRLRNCVRCTREHPPHSLCCPFLDLTAFTFIFNLTLMTSHKLLKMSLKHQKNKLQSLKLQIIPQNTSNQIRHPCFVSPKTPCALIPLCPHRPYKTLRPLAHQSTFI